MLKQDQDGGIPLSERSPDVQDHDIPINGETEVYKEVSNLLLSLKLLKSCSDYAISADADESSYEFVPDSSPSVYTELNRNPENTSDNTYQKLLKPCYDYAIPADADESSYEFVPDSSPPVYNELNRNPENTSDNTYQKLLKPAYVIPAENHSYEEVGKKKSPPGYTELDQTKRDDATHRIKNC